MHCVGRCLSLTEVPLPPAEHLQHPYYERPDYQIRTALGDVPDPAEPNDDVRYLKCVGYVRKVGVRGPKRTMEK